METLLLVTPSSNTFYTLSAPLGQAYVAKELENYEVFGIDLNVYRNIYQMSDLKMFETIKKIVTLYDVKYVGISILEETLQESIQVATLCKNLGCVVMAGGIMPTLFPEDMPECFDFVLRGDNEKELASLLFCLDEGLDYSHINGISYRNNGIWIHQGLAIEPNCKNGVLPAREIFDKFNFGYEYKTARMITSRGCVYNCSFCTNKKIKSQFCRRSVEDIVNEIHYLVIEKQIEQIIFSDDQFLGSNLDEYKSALAVIRGIKDILISHNVRLNFQVRADHLLKCQEKLPELLLELESISKHFVDPNKEAHNNAYGRNVQGVGIDIGIEAFSDSTLRYFRKGITSTTNIRCLETLSTKHIDIGIYMILFHPLVTIENIIYELECYYKYYLKHNFASKLVFSNLFKPLVAYKGTEIYDKLKEEHKLVNGHFYTFQDLRVAAFYVVIENELAPLCTDESYTMTEVYETVLSLCYRCKDLKIEKDSILEKVVCDTDNSELVDAVYETYFS